MLNVLGKETPFNIKVEGQTPDFYGVVTFELLHKDVGGFECGNSLIQHYSRAVFEANIVRKKAFESLKDFFFYYDIETETEKHYRPSLDLQAGKIAVKTA